MELAQMWNGKFALCPECGEVMAHNVCGGWWCYSGCGLIVPGEENTGRVNHEF